ncbi:NAD-dependent epimerase/dehydratase family protein [Leucobacter sp. CSA2]|uniref:NAD-dependent epimerase/dehydratase family protein n=1 Tax=Leucobacter edaphi TaxID=2796472 RepID=A0A934QDC3_9MICO|nr:NAD-dependent epimerase/dehydratase family protein [Leucobacter edaphi]MBK0422534.1 NAD-dependent epimerase/dehydratase family protein [Leucobacter edaphi]
MNILVLGGTAFLGRAIALAALVRGHEVTCLARGTDEAPGGVDFVRADRDESDGLRLVRDRRWDAVIDVSRQPGQVRRAVRELRTRHWVFVSSGNAYADFSRIEQDEDAATLAPLASDVMADMSQYGPAKVACEQAVRSVDGPATIVRSGLIAGPGDATGRSGYWPWRFAHPTGPDVIAPDDPTFPCAMIDVRDLADWIVAAAEQRIDGVFNATGPTTTLERVLEAAAEVAGSDVPVRPVPAARLAELGVGGWMGPATLPLWIDDADWRGFATMNTERARAAGLVTRPLTHTLRDALAYEETRTSPRLTGLDDEEERRVRLALDREADSSAL